ncbi:MAG: bifunctional YncE family protein/alkaline phosphatase family protein [Opitutae bacterium]
MVAGILLTAAGLAAVLDPVPVWPGKQPDGSVLLPNQWSLKPVGQQVSVGDFPVNLALHPSGRCVAVLDSGYGQHEIRLLEVASRAVVAQVNLDVSFYGLAWAPDGTRLFASGAGAETVHVFDFKDGKLSNPHTLRVRDEKEQGVPAGLAVSKDGRALFVAEAWGQSVVKISTKNGQRVWERRLNPPMGAATTDHEGVRWMPADHPDAPFPYGVVVDERTGRLYVSLWAKATVLVLKADTGAELARWPVGDHPNEMVLSADGRLFVAEANRNTVSVVNVKDGQVQEQLCSAMDPAAPPGSMPNSLALSPDGELLFVANANNNNVAVFAIGEARHSRSLGFIPTGWFPTSVRVSRDGRTLLVANGKGVTSAANPAGPFPGDTRPRNLQEYIGGLMQGTVGFIDLPSPAERVKRFGEFSQLAFQVGPRATPAARPEASPIPGRVGEASPIKYVFYVIKENRTFDQILGDLGRGNGDPRLCLFGEQVTPNQHALAREFATLDNFYADGEVSADGHEWSMGAYATDYVEKAWPLNYGHGQRHKIDYPSEGHFPVAYPANGYIWNRAAEAGVTYRSYGEFVSQSRGSPEVMEASLPVLRGHIDLGYRGFDMDYPDVRRAERFISELRRYEATGEMPRLQVLRLSSDHTSGTRLGKPTPTAAVADNDRALGLLVEAISHSKFWAQSAIFVLEDDAQNGPDHVDAHRIPAFVISPYTRRHAVDSSLYSTTSMLRTMELILGLAPMSQYDAAARPMDAVFAAQPDLTPFTALAAGVDLNARNGATAWGAKVSNQMDFREADRADDIVLNEIIWRSVRGADQPMPAPLRAAFFKAHPAEADDE